MYADAIYAVYCFVVIKLAHVIYTKYYAPIVMEWYLSKTMIGRKNELSNNERNVVGVVVGVVVVVEVGVVVDVEVGVVVGVDVEVEVVVAVVVGVGVEVGV